MSHVDGGHSQSSDLSPKNSIPTSLPPEIGNAESKGSSNTFSKENPTPLAAPGQFMGFSGIYGKQTRIQARIQSQALP